MRRRIYWLLPDLRSARRVMDDLLVARVPVRDLHFVARDGADMSGLHAANVLQTSDVMQAVQSGLLIGGLVGAAMGAVAAWFFPFSGHAPQWNMVAMLAVAGALVGAWAASLIGVSTPSRRLDRFGAALRAGSIVLMVDLPRERVDEIEKRLGRLHPEARLERAEPRAHAFP